MTFKQGHALLIGVGSYRESPRLDVPTTATEARALAAVLRDPGRCGYPAAQTAVLCDGDATRDRVLAALHGLAERTTADETVLLFYSGHGGFLSDGGYCLTTHDTRFEAGGPVAGTAISQIELLAALKELRPRRVLLLFNACHAGELTPTLGGRLAPDEIDGKAHSASSLPEETSGALLATGEGRVIITACRDRQYSFIGGGPLTIFGQALLDALRGAGARGERGTISVFDLYSHLYHAVLAAHQGDRGTHDQQPDLAIQEPELTVLKGVGPFAVALWNGGAHAGLSATPRPAPPAPRRELERYESEAMLRKIVGNAIQVAPAATVGSIEQNNQSGYTFSIAVGENRGTIVGENKGTINQQVTSRSGPGEPSDPLEGLIVDLRKRAKRAATADLAANLETAAGVLEAALKAQREGNAEGRLIMLRAARAMLTPYVTEYQELAPTVNLITSLTIA